MIFTENSEKRKGYFWIEMQNNNYLLHRTICGGKLGNGATEISKFLFNLGKVIYAVFIQPFPLMSLCLSLFITHTYFLPVLPTK